MNNSDLIKSQAREIERLKREIESKDGTVFKNKTMIDPNKFVVQLTVGEFLELMERTEQPKIIDTTGQACVYRLQGIADYLHISKPTVSVWMNSGKLSSVTFHKSGRLIWVTEEDLNNWLLDNKK